MKIHIINNIKKAFGIVAALCVASPLALTSCSDDPDAENYYTFTGEMISNYLDNRPEQFSEFTSILKKSGMYGMMATYGTYTCLAPTNDAIYEYLKERGKQCVDSLTKAECDTIAWNHIINKAYFTTDLSNGNIPTTNMNDRFLTFSCGTDEADNNIAYYINTRSQLIVRDDSVENGVVHTLDHVIQPSNEYLPDLILNDEKLSIFSAALTLTGMKDSLYAYLDKDYTIDVDSAYGNKMNFFRLGGSKNGGEDHFGNYIPKRMKRFTAFVETDEVFNEHGIYVIGDLIDYAKEVYDAVYPEDADLYDKDFTDRRNPLNRFVSYHLLPYYGGYQDWTVCDMNGIDLKSVCSVPSVADCTDWYTTLMPGTIIKMSTPTGSTSKFEAGLYINRKGVQSKATVRGVKVLDPAQVQYEDQQALNGIYHYIDDILTYNVTTRDVVFNDRIRINAVTLTPEFMNAGARGGTDCTGFKIVEGWKFNGKTPTLSLRNRNVWNATYADCIDVIGQLDISFKLPPVPANTYEIRFAYGARNTGGVIQVYFGTKDNMQPMGIPIDFRVYGPDPTIGWVADIEGDEDANRAIDKAMHNRGYLKEMDSWKQGGDGNLRANSSKLRRILTTQTMNPDTEYWIRLKLVLDDEEAETPINYFELCPKSVYAGVQAEDTH